MLRRASCGDRKNAADCHDNGTRRESREKTLILTHTNAGVFVIKSRLRRFGVDSSKYSVFTICAWAERISHAYPLLSEVNAEATHSDPNYYTQCVLGAVKLCSSDVFGSVISASYSLILIDEYQDCDMAQHCLAITLRDIIGSVAVFGDRLQQFSISRVSNSLIGH